MSAFWYYVFTLVFFLFDYFILAMGLNIQYGETGILNFAYIGFVAVGAYITGVTSLPASAGTGQQYILGWGLPFPINLILGGLTASALAFVVALIALRRLRTDYLAVVLISLSLVLYDVINNYVPLFNGADGLYNVPEPLAGFFKLTTNAFVPFFAMVTGVVALIMWWVMSRITNAPLGRTLRAIRDDDGVAATLGKGVFRYQPTMIRPVLARRIPTTVLANVDFPAPLGPMIVVTVPCSTDNEMSVMMGVRPYPAVTFSASSAGIDYLT